MHRLLMTSLVFALVQSLPAQRANVYGKLVERGNGYALDCTNIVVRSARISVRDFRGKVVLASGTVSRSGKTLSLEAASLRRSPHVLQMNGSGRIGEKFDIEVKSDGATAVVVYVAAAPGFVPLEPFASFLQGSFLLDPRGFLYLSSGSASSGYRFDYRIPRVSALVGVQVYTQAAVLRGRDLIYINSACRKISSN